MLAVAAAAAAASAPVRGLVVTFPQGWEGRARACVEDLGVPVLLVVGGGSRQASVRAALAEVPGTVDVVAVHDAARPFAPPDLFAQVLHAVEAGADGAVPVLAVTDTVLRVRREVVEGVEPRDELALGQTPQAFRTSVLREAHAKAEAAGASFTDDASMLRWAGFDVRADPGRRRQREDHHPRRPRAGGPAHGRQRWLNPRWGSASMCIPSRPTASCGSVVCCSKATSACRDTRTVTWSVTRWPTRLLGAVALGDIGEHFPETAPDTAGITGDELLTRTLRLLSDVGRAPVSMDITLLCDRPHIAPRRGEMRERLAAISGVPVERVSVKATRPEGLGLVGDGIGCLALAVVG